MSGAGAQDKTPVAAIKKRASKRVRAKVAEPVSSITLQRMAQETVPEGATVYTDQNYGVQRAREEELQARGGKPLSRRVHKKTSSHARRGVFLVYAQKRARWSLPQDEQKAPSTLHRWVCGKAQHPPACHYRADRCRYRGNEREKTQVQRTDSIEESAWWNILSRNLRKTSTDPLITTGGEQKGPGDDVKSYSKRKGRAISKGERELG